MLDDLKYIAQRDKSDALGIAQKQYEQLKFNDIDLSHIDYFNPGNIVISGMGGSALGPLIFKQWQNPRSSSGGLIDINRDYGVSRVDSDTLFIASSYSGNTEETLEALSEATDNNAKIVIITNGGKLAEIARQNNIPMLEIPTCLQPRMAALSTVKILALLFDHIKVTNNATTELEAMAYWLGEEANKLAPTVGTSENTAKQIAEYLVGKTGIIYSGPLLSAAAYKWKISLNENAKNLAWHNLFPEFNHNEFMGWTSHPTEKVFGVIELQSSFDHPQIKKRFEVSNRLLSGKMPAPKIVDAVGDSELKQLLWTIQLGDFTSLYLAMLNNVDPTPVELIEKLKQNLA